MNSHINIIDIRKIFSQSQNNEINENKSHSYINIVNNFQKYKDYLNSGKNENRNELNLIDPSRKFESNNRFENEKYKNAHKTDEYNEYQNIIKEDSKDFNKLDSKEKPFNLYEYINSLSPNMSIKSKSSKSVKRNRKLPIHISVDNSAENHHIRNQSKSSTSKGKNRHNSNSKNKENEENLEYQNLKLKNKCNLKKSSSSKLNDRIKHNNTRNQEDLNMNLLSEELKKSQSILNNNYGIFKNEFYNNNEYYNFTKETSGFLEIPSFHLWFKIYFTKNHNFSIDSCFIFDEFTNYFKKYRLNEENLPFIVRVYDTFINDEMFIIKVHDLLGSKASLLIDETLVNSSDKKECNLKHVNIGDILIVKSGKILYSKTIKDSFFGNMSELFILVNGNQNNFIIVAY